MSELASVGLSSKQAAKFEWLHALGWWLSVLAALLAGYALLGKGFAYLGLQPIYPGELVLALGLLSLLGARGWYHSLYVPYTWLLLTFCLWGVMQTLPHLAVHRFEALRDAVLYGYSLFALLVMVHLTTRPWALPRLVRGYAWLTLPLVLIPLPIWLATQVFEESIPNLPWADVPVLSVKGGDILVHLAGVLAFWTAYPIQVYSPRVRLVGLLAWVAAVAAIGSETRSGLLAVGLVLAICLVAYPASKLLRWLVLTGVLAALLLGITGARIPLGDRERVISFEQVGENALSIISGSQKGDLDDTKHWRLEWWRDIVDYTIYGRYFWTGKGFGVNLADDDGYQVVAESESPLLRSPHNGHMTMLARAGVPGLAIWLSLLLAWSGTLAVSFVRARLQGQRCWSGLFLFLLSYGLAMLVQASFDVYLEGPVGGIWFWVICGAGVAATWIYRYLPDVLDDHQLIGEAP